MIRRCRLTARTSTATYPRNRVLKPRHSIFYATTLRILLEYLGARTLILTGVAGDICILFSASDAYVRGFELVVPSDCVASEDPEENRRALCQIKSVLEGSVLPSARLGLKALRRLKRSSPRTAAGKS